MTYYEDVIALGASEDGGRAGVSDLTIQKYGGGEAKYVLPNKCVINVIYIY